MVLEQQPIVIAVSTETVSLEMIPNHPDEESSGEMNPEKYGRVKNKKESFKFGRLKCRSAASNDDNREDFAKPCHSADSEVVHKLDAPWLADGKNKKKNRREVGPSTREDRTSTSKSEQAKKHLRSALRMQNRSASVEDNSTVLPETSLRPSHYVFPGIKNYEKSNQSERQKNESSSIAPSDETYSSNNYLGKNLSRSVESSPVPPENNTTSNLRDMNRNNPPRITPITQQMDYTNEYTDDQQLEFRSDGDKRYDLNFSGGKATPRRNNTSPSRLRRQGESQNKRFDYQRGIYTDFDRETLMALELQRDLDRMSFKCGPTGGDIRRSSNSAIPKKSQEAKSTGFSIFPASISCFNPTAQVDTFEPTDGSVHRINVHNDNNRAWVDKSNQTPSRPKPMNQTFCGGASSALLCDIDDDDELWKYYDGIQPVRQASIPERQSSKIDVRESKVSRYPMEEEREEVYATNGTPTMSYESDRYDQVRHQSHAPRVENTRHQTRYHAEERDQPVRGFEFDNRYESNGLGEVQPTKEELLNQMRQAVQKASAQLKKTRTMETEYSDGSTYDVSNLPKQHSFPTGIEGRAANGFQNNKYETSLETRSDRYGYI